MRRIHAYVSIRRQAITQAQREAIAARGIEWDAHPARDVDGVMRLLLELWGPRDQLLDLRDWLIAQGFQPIVCAAFVEVNGEWLRMQNVPINRAAYNAVRPPKGYDEQSQPVYPDPAEPILPVVWFSGRPWPQEDVEEPNEPG